MIPSGSELIIILFAVLILFGGKKIPGIARNIGKIIGDMQKATREFKREMDIDIMNDDDKNKPDSYKG
ncbi:twin-arginine translocase TatA/TatE family subunit [candidate division LCP-89 bacterium B3_LCP]|uniref:Twin-arginine translocase TatA/TatE family subunit n=1 Tax=candidate division LCP-89 bacterium B3_LCP TaxID=2012998 RepID=A0A532UZU4_UNCL8|nr:MAG: twin-arginine translocase TatA/TatE family subunit [candidate division LCP-89 bacterium B3_LCP]